MRRTTLLLDDSLYKKVKTIGKLRGTSLKEIINDLLRSALNSTVEEKTTHLPIPLHRKNGPQEGIDISDRSSLYDILDHE
ncbi:MAG: hypothetical protein HYU97_03840 [Deltaproteobacteria bacterium]|nr:hypothetical protein [Deltaproteobacteria bacterium]